MLKGVFIGSDNMFNEILVHWLSQRVDMRGVVWVSATAWQRTLQGKLSFTKKRRRRYGLAKVIDEAMFFLYAHRFLMGGDKAELKRDVYEPYWAAHGVPRWQGPAIYASDVNEPEVLDFIQTQEAEVVFAMCINNFFGERIRSIPRHGVLLWHEGITPEYKGLYSPFWAVHNLDFDNVGYTLLRMNDKLDAGEIFVQGRAVDIDPFRHHANYMGHKAIIDSLPAVEQFLKELEAGQAQPIERTGAQAGYYTYPGMSDFIRQRRRLHEWQQRQSKPTLATTPTGR